MTSRLASIQPNSTDILTNNFRFLVTKFFSQNQTRIEWINENGKIDFEKKIGWKSVKLG